MPEYRPSKYILHSGYATVKTYGVITATLTIPDSVHADIDDVVFSVQVDLPTSKGLGWRSIVETDKDNFGVSTPNFLLPCTITDSYDTYSSFIYGEVIRCSSYQIELRVVLSGNYYGGADYSDIGQTLTLKLQPYLSPFES